MQATRQRILEILREQGPATVEELSHALDLTSVTVRHHLDILRQEGLIQICETRHRGVPGRPQYVYSLTDAAASHFPDNYPSLVGAVLDRIQGRLTPPAVNVFFAEIGHDLARAAPPPVPGETLPERLDGVVAFLSEKGYVARWEHTTAGYVLHTHNCPYHEIADAHPELCIMDMRLMTELLSGRTIERISRVVEGASSCTYLVRE
jgi:predicted ArsR family transcriptional regulator